MLYKIFLSLTLMMPLSICGFTQEDRRLFLIDSLVNELPNLEEDTNKAKTLFDLSSLHLRIDLEKSEKYATLCLQLTTKLNANDMRRSVLYRLAFINYRTANYYQCIDYAQSGIDLIKGNTSAKAEMLNIKGIGYKYLGEYDKALQAQIASLDINKLHDIKSGVANNYVNIGELNRLKKDFSDAEKNYNQAKEVFEKIDDINGVVKCYNNIGVSKQEQKKHEEALVYLNKALVLRKTDSDPFSEASILGNIGFNYMGLNEFQKAKEYFDRSLEIRVELGDKFGEAIVLQNFGSLYKGLGQNEKSIEFMNKAYRIFEANDIKDDQSATAKFLAELYREIGEYQKAFDYYTTHVRLDSTIFATEKQKEIEQIKGVYDTKLKDQKIAEMQQADELKNQKLQESRNMIIGATAAGGLLLLLSVVALNAYRQKRKANGLLKVQNQKITTQSDIIQEKNTEILDSITYAKRIQEAILPNESKMKAIFKNSLVYFLPKDIVSGDFYWVEETEKNNLIAVADCTGHGVPGALVSMIGHNALHKAVNEYNLYQPSKILDFVHDNMLQTLRNENKDIRDGMDISVCAFNKDFSEMQFAGAMSVIYHVSNGELQELKGDRMAIASDYKTKAFATQTIALTKGDGVYIFSDGFPDQFGGERGKKYRYAKFKEFLLSIQNQSPSQQKESLGKEFENWKGNLNQVDDVCVVGVRL